jgi:hypothetical protein
LLLNIVFSLIGYLYIGEWKRGLIIFIIFSVVEIIEMVSYRFLGFEVWFISLMLLNISLLIFIISDTIKLTRKKNKTDYIIKPYNKCYVYFLIFIVIRTFYNTTGIFDIEDLYEASGTQTSSMDNTILSGDYMIIDKTSYGLKKFFYISFYFRIGCQSVKILSYSNSPVFAMKQNPRMI